MAGYCRCGVVLYRSREGLCDECYPLSKALAEKEDREIDSQLAAAKLKHYQKGIQMKFETHNTNTEIEDEACDGTWLQGEMWAEYDSLVKAFGEPTDGDGEKVDACWSIKFADGTIATVYNYKDGINYCGPVEGTQTRKIMDWHIGGFNPDAVDRVREALGYDVQLSTIFRSNRKSHRR